MWSTWETIKDNIQRKRRIGNPKEKRGKKVCICKIFRFLCYFRILVIHVSFIILGASGSGSRSGSGFGSAIFISSFFLRFSWSWTGSPRAPGSGSRPNKTKKKKKSVFENEIDHIPKMDHNHKMDQNTKNESKSIKWIKIHKMDHNL